MSFADENRVKGNYGVYALMKELSKFCLIRPVFEGTDVGIDLYCETFENPGKGGRPFLHFWSQVKTTKKTTVNNAMTFSFKGSHLKYWSRQPVPVFAFLVHVPNWPKTDSIYPFHIIDIKEHIYQNRDLLDGRSHTLHSNFFVKSEAELGDFISNKIPYISAAHKIPEGIVSSVPTIDPKYENQLVMDNCHNYLYNILWQIRRTSTSAIMGSYDYAQDNEDIKNYIKKLCEIANVFFDNDNHWETFYSLGLATLLNKNHKKAKALFERAIVLIEEDPNIQGKKNWESIKELIQKKINECDQHL